MTNPLSLAIQRRAARFSISVEELLKRDTEALRNLTVGPLCLDPSIFDATGRQYDQAHVVRMLEHVLECPRCAASVDLHFNHKKD